MLEFSTNLFPCYFHTTNEAVDLPDTKGCSDFSLISFVKMSVRQHFNHWGADFGRDICEVRGVFQFGGKWVSERDVRRSSVVGTLHKQLRSESKVWNKLWLHLKRVIKPDHVDFLILCVCYILFSRFWRRAFFYLGIIHLRVVFFESENEFFLRFLDLVLFSKPGVWGTKNPIYGYWYLKRANLLIYSSNTAGNKYGLSKLILLVLVEQPGRRHGGGRSRSYL